MGILNKLTEINSSNSENKINGVAIALVTNITDEQGLGRVKVTYPWFSDVNESHWARVATFMAGPGRGAFFVPEVNDEVLVAFEHGDINAPYIIGTLWNGQDTPPVDNSDGSNHTKQIKSRCGHTLTFDDTPENECFQIQTNVGHVLKLDDKNGSGKVSLKTSSGHALELNDEGNEVSLKDSNGNKISIDASSGDISVHSSGNVHVQASGQVDVQGSMINLGDGMNFCNDLPACLFTGSPHAIQNTKVKC